MFPAMFAVLRCCDARCTASTCLASALGHTTKSQLAGSFFFPAEMLTPLASRLCTAGHSLFVNSKTRIIESIRSSPPKLSERVKDLDSDV